ncbi:MAG: protein GlmU [Pseudomonadota bacterium]
MTDYPNEKLRRLMEKGVRIPTPESVDIGDEVSVDRISGQGVTIHAGSRIRGAGTLIMAGARIGEEAPATVDNCHIGPEVQLKGGFYSGSVFLKGAAVGSSAHIRPGTIFEEKASAAHAVGLKQSILFPYVTIGSLINFCDILMSGGTGPKHHSEVGSSYIHFNFTPNQDKATASLLGDVPQGVMLDQDPIFLGGQGGLVGPCNLAFGTVIAAGTIYRKDESRPGRLLTAATGRGGSIPYTAGIYRSVKRVVANNMNYLANLIALGQWYRHARKRFIGAEFSEALWEGLIAALDADTAAHVRQFEGFVAKLTGSVDKLRQGIITTAGDHLIAQHEAVIDRWPEMLSIINELRAAPGDVTLQERFLEALSRRIARSEGDYLSAIHALDEQEKESGRRWLAGIVDQVVAPLEALLPALFGSPKKQI